MKHMLLNAWLRLTLKGEQQGRKLNCSHKVMWNFKTLSVVHECDKLSFLHEWFICFMYK
ncbi:hypothetical protein DPMN_040903 [Dreissena polymorpha]|uniref:Uncharacterized protein n=1 Tax=Dreissena polymorpha TaxID=45954 RepID=A0A9D4CYH6_DREPO|nr:hypothetical protein DPMN_040903 [Dreissena polymorpha]